MFGLLIIGWALAAVGLVSGNGVVLVAAAPFLVLVGVRALASRSAWSAVALSCLRSDLCGSEYRERVAASMLLRRVMGGGLVLAGLAWLILGLSL